VENGRPSERARPVSCVALSLYTDYLSARGIEPGELFRGLPYPLEHFRSRLAWIDWQTFQRIESRVEALCPGVENVHFELGRHQMLEAGVGWVSGIGYSFISPYQSYRIIPRAVRFLFRGLDVEVSRRSMSSARLIYTFPTGCEPSDAFLETVLGLLAGAPTPLGVAEAKVVQTRYAPRLVIYDVSWSAKNPPLAQLPQRAFERLRRTFAHRRLAKERTLLELEESNRLLLDKVSELTEAREEQRETNRLLRQEIRERERAERERQELDEALHQARKLEAVGRLAGGIAHDINNILTAILGHTSVMEQELSEDHVHAEDVKSIVQASLRGRDLVRNLLGFARKGQRRRVQVNLGETFDEAVTLLEPTIPKNIVLQVERTEPAPVVMGDPGQLAHILVNLCLNAVDAMPEGGRLRLTLTAERGESVETRALIEVIDDGEGMSEQVREQAFDPFFTTKPLGQGTGLGLPMVYGAVKDHDGDVMLESVPGRGTRVAVRLPALGLESQAPNATESGSSLPSVMPATVEEARVLIVDDEPLVRRAGRRILMQQGHSVLEAAGGEQALELYGADEETIDLVLLDMLMPGMDGKETYQRLRKLDPDVVVILTTGHSLQGDIDQLLADGARGFVPKPFTAKELTSVVARVLARR
jgi:signal transduction histidine kinase/CheY-like chemotaxis protein